MQNTVGLPPDDKIDGANNFLKTLSPTVTNPKFLGKPTHKGRLVEVFPRTVL